MLIEQIDVVGLEPFQAAFDGGPDMGWLAVDAAMVHAGVRVDVPAKLGGDLDLVAQRLEGLAHHRLIRQGTIGFGGVEEIDAALYRLANEGDHLRPILNFTRFAISHAAQRECRHFKAACTQLSLVHHYLPQLTKCFSLDPMQSSRTANAVAPDTISAP